MLTHFDKGFAAAFSQDVPEVLNEDHKVMVISSQGERDDAGCGAKAAICYIDHHRLLHPFKIIIKPYIHPRKLVIEKCCYLHCIRGSAKCVLRLLSEDEDYILRLGSIGIDGIFEVELKRSKDVFQEALVTSI